MLGAVVKAHFYSYKIKMLEVGGTGVSWDNVQEKKV
jgi:hypothetical protein